MGPSEDITKEMVSLSSKAPMTSVKTCDNTERERAADIGGDLKAIKLISEANGEASTEPGSVFKEPEPVLKDWDFKDFLSVTKEPGSEIMESKSVTMECPSIIDNAEEVTKDSASTAKELASVTKQPDSVLSSPVSLAPGGKLMAKTSVTEPQMKSSVVGGVPQGVPTESQSARLLHGQNISASSEATERIAEPPETYPTGLTHPDIRTREPEEVSSLVCEHPLYLSPSFLSHFQSLRLDMPL